jgi:hypothetical protein
MFILNIWNRKMKKIIFVIFLMVLSANSIFSQIVISSTFDNDIDGWRVIGDVDSLPIFNVIGGNPGGYISAIDKGKGLTWKWVAPQKFRGNLSVFYNGFLKFDLKQNYLTRQFEEEDIVISNLNKRLVYTFNYHPDTSWTAFSISLNESSNWFVGSINGLKANYNDFIDILNNVDSIIIRGEFSEDWDIGGLDNFVIESQGKINSIIHLQSGDISGYPGDIIEVPFILKDLYNLQSSGATNLKADLTYNSTLLAPIDYPFQKIDDTTSKITIDSLPVNKAVGDTLAKIRFKVGLGNADNCDLILSNGKAVGGTLDISLSNGKFKLLGVCTEGGKRLINPNGNAIDLKISPNPSDGNIIAAFNLIEDNNTTFRIYDNTGNVVYEKNIEKYTGKMEMNIDTSTFGNGLYFVSLQTQTVRIVKPLMIVK